MPVALISVSEKNGIDVFAKELLSLGWEIWASSGTARYLTDRKIQVRDIALLVGSPILGHRVVTLSREIHAGLLAGDTPEDNAELIELGLSRIDLVCVDLYPLQKTIEMHGFSRESVIEQTDVGGIALLHAGAKGRRIVIAHPTDRSTVLAWLRAGRPNADEFITELVIRAEAIVADYCLASARYHSDGRYDGNILSSVRTCAYGENAWQKPAALLSLATNDPLAIDAFVQEGGILLSYNNFADIDRFLQTMTHIAAAFDIHRGLLADAPMHIAIAGKHGNACGAAIGEESKDVLKKAIDGDLRAIFGGVVMLNFPVSEELAEILLTYNVPVGTRRLLDVIIAPLFTNEAKDILSTRKGNKCRLVSNGALASLTKESLDVRVRYRFVRGGYLRQPNYAHIPDFQNAGVERYGNVSVESIRDLILAFAIGATSNSNTVTIVHNGMLLGNGVGQQDRVGACILALRRAHDSGHSTIGAAVYSDSFFPFIDGPEALANAGITAIFASSGSVKDDEVKQFCAQRGVSLCMVSDTLGRGFFGH